MKKIDYTKNPLVKKFIELETSENKTRNIFLYAGGGYGKTTAMLCLFKYLLELASSGENIVPIYIDVKLMEYDTQNPIINYIYSEYSGNDTDESMVKNLFSNQAPTLSKKYTYYILIDGLNETNDCNKNKLKDKISKLAKFSFVKLIVSSRIQETFDKTFFCVLEFQKLDEEQIKDYLDKNFGDKYNEQTKVKEINKSLIEILQIPMFMKVFSKTYDKKKSPYPDIYDERTVRRADILDSYVQKILIELKERTNSYDNDILEFVINFYLPALAFQMAEENVLDIDSEIIDGKLNWGYFIRFFKGTKKEKIKSLIKSDKFKPVSISSKNFALINDNDGNYSFIHQIWRDFFLAKHIINCMNAEKFDDLEISIDESIRQFVGELVREYIVEYKYSKKPAYKSTCENGKIKFIDNLDSRRCECDFEEKDNLDTWSESPIEHFMQQHNMNSKNPIPPIVTRNLTDIMKTSRNNRITADYSNLDLIYCDFLNSDLFNSSFSYSNLNSKSFVPIGHKKHIKSAYITNGGKYILSFECENFRNIFIWETYLGKNRRFDISRYFNESIIDDISVVDSNETSFLIQLKYNRNRTLTYFILYCESLKIHNLETTEFSCLNSLSNIQFAQEYSLVNYFYDDNNSVLKVKYQPYKTLHYNASYIVSKNEEKIATIDAKKFGKPQQYDYKSDTLVCINNTDIILWSLKKLIIKNIFVGYSYPSTNMVEFFDVNSQLLFAQGYWGGCVCIFDYYNSRICSKIYSKGDRVITIKIINGTDIVVVGTDSYIEFYNWKTRDLLHVIDEFQDDICNIAFFKNNEVMVVTSACDDNELIRIYELNFDENIKCNKIHLGKDLSKSPDILFGNASFKYDIKSDCLYISTYLSNPRILFCINCINWSIRKIEIAGDNSIRYIDELIETGKTLNYNIRNKLIGEEMCKNKYSNIEYNVLPVGLVGCDFSNTNFSAVKNINELGLYYLLHENGGVLPEYDLNTLERSLKE